MAANDDGNGGGNDRPIRSLESLYKYVVSVSDNPQPTAPSQLNQEDQEFLSKALDALAEDPVSRMKNCLVVLQTMDDSQEGLQKKQAALEEITDFCNQIDFASDFHKIGGFPTLKALLEHDSVELRLQALELVGTLVQNNPYCQDRVLEANLMPTLLHTVDTNPNPTIQAKALFATSCLTRDVPSALEAFTQNDGFSVLMRAMQSGSDKLKVKAAFMLDVMCSSQPSVRDTLVDMGMVEQLVGLLGEEHSVFHEHLMSALLSLVRGHPRAQTECLRSELGLLALLRDRVTSLAGKEESWEERDHAENLLKLLTADGDTETVR